MLALGFSAGIPVLLIFSSLSIWLSEAGIRKSTVTFFSWAALGYSFKFVWAPLIDKLPVPWLSFRLGRRRSWLLLSQGGVMVAIAWMAFTNPQNSTLAMALAAVLLGFSSATQDVVIDALRIELASPRLQAMLASTYITGYRVATLLAGAGVLYLAQWFGSTRLDYVYEAWRNAYLCMVLMMAIGLVTTLVIKEPSAIPIDKSSANPIEESSAIPIEEPSANPIEEPSANPIDESSGGPAARDYPYPAIDYAKLFVVFVASILVIICVFVATPSAADLGLASLPVEAFLYSTSVLLLALATAFGVAFAAVRLHWIRPDLFRESYSSPVVDFFRRYGRMAWWILLLVGFYRIADIVLGVIANVFYQDVGYSKAEIAGVSKTFGVFMTICGSFVGGLLVMRVGILRMLIIGAVLVALTNLLFMWIARIEPNIYYLAAVIAADNLSQGLSIAAFIAWLSSLTNTAFTATQYAIFSSLMTLFPKLIGGYSGTLVEAMGYSNFFLLTAVLGVPVVFLVYFIGTRSKQGFSAEESLPENAAGALSTSSPATKSVYP